MTDTLEQRLADLARSLEIPDAPGPPRLRLPPRRSPLPLRRPLALALALFMLAAGTALAVPASRHAVLRFLGLRIERVRALPPPRGGPLDLGRAISLASARDAASFTALLPPRASAAYLDHDVPGGRISLRIGGVLVIEVRGSATPYLTKILSMQTRARLVRVGADRGVYISGAPHELIFAEADGAVRNDAVHVARNVLLWQHGDLVVRIEGVRDLAAGEALARRLR